VSQQLLERRNRFRVLGDIRQPSRWHNRDAGRHRIDADGIAARRGASSAGCRTFKICQPACATKRDDPQTTLLERLYLQYPI